MYSVGITFNVQMAHFHDKIHNEFCSTPHGHNQKIEIVFNAENLDQSDIACDYVAIETALKKYINSMDHAILINSDSKHSVYFKTNFKRVIIFDKQDPTSETVAKMVYNHVADILKNGLDVTSETGTQYTISKNIKVDYVKVWETEHLWASYRR